MTSTNAANLSLLKKLGELSNGLYIRVFSYCVAVSEVNTLLACHYFQKNNQGQRMSTIDFRKILAEELIYNPYFMEETGQEHQPRNMEDTPRPKRARVLTHERCKPPKWTGKWDGNAWKPSSLEYLQRHCASKINGKRCNQKTRMYCKCNKLHFYCTDCLMKHLGEVET
eukprot:m.171858 g.171858  ORF g.171858 m.171858 type:complete len:169 (-) comp15358_c1_seq3:137-643(-)